MQTGSVTRNGRGWRGHWREDGKRHSTATFARKGEARVALNDELDRIAQGDRYRAPITLAELADRFLAQHPASTQTITYARRRLVRPLAVLGDAQAGDVSTEALQRVVTAVPGKSYRRDITRTLRMVYRWGVDAGLVDHNPAAKVKAPKPIRGENIIPFESWAEVDLVAEECGRWGPLVIFMADTGARPAEAVAVEHRNVHGSTVELPGHKTARAWRSVHMTERGVDAVAAVPRAIATRKVFHVDGRPISWDYFRREVWAPALETASLDARAPYCLRHTFAYWSLRAGVPIASVASEMGHESTEHTFRVYGGWCLEVGADAAALRSAWATSTAATTKEG
jgi:integrase